MKAAVVGLGKIGLPLLAQIASAGVRAVGCDIDPDVVAAVSAGRSPITGEPGLEEAIATHVGAGVLKATTDTAQGVSEAEVVIVVVPLGIDDEHAPDFSILDAAVEDVGRGLQAGRTVIVETTVPVGTTRGRVAQVLQEASGLAPGADFHLAFSPERVSSGSVFRDLRRYPKLVGGIDEASGRAAAAFYERVLTFDDRHDLGRPNGVWMMASAEAAEFAKLAETTYRDVNIALANEFAEATEAIGVDVAEIIAAANSQPYSHIHRPGLVGGHCIPVYPHLYLAGHPAARLPRRAREVNEQVAERLVVRLSEALGGLSGQKVAVLGAAYRGGVKETAHSGVFSLVKQVAAHGGRPVVHDPLFSDEELAALGLEPHRLGDEVAAAIVHTDHPHYRDLVADDLPGCRALFDVRGLVHAERLGGIEVVRLGDGRPLS